jgi:hypothetical protein
MDGLKESIYVSWAWICFLAFAAGFLVGYFS